MYVPRIGYIFTSILRTFKNFPFYRSGNWWLRSQNQWETKNTYSLCDSLECSAFAGWYMWWQSGWMGSVQSSNRWELTETGELCDFGTERDGQGRHAPWEGSFVNCLQAANKSALRKWRGNEGGLSQDVCWHLTPWHGMRRRGCVCVCLAHSPEHQVLAARYITGTELH
jgi:hypothetical protein